MSESRAAYRLVHRDSRRLATDECGEVFASADAALTEQEIADLRSSDQPITHVAHLRDDAAALHTSLQQLIADDSGDFDAVYDVADADRMRSPYEVVDAAIDSAVTAAKRVTVSMPHASSALAETSTNTTAPRQSKRRRIGVANTAATAVTDDIARNFTAPTDFPVAAQLSLALRAFTQLVALTPISVRKPKRNRNIITPTLFTAQLTDTDEPRTLVDHDSVLLSVQVFSANSARLLQTFTVVDTQPLTALSDVIRCPRDAFADKKTAADTSNVFFIESALYDDTRAQKHRLSFDIVRDRHEQSDSQTHDDAPSPLPYVQSDQSVTFASLRLRLGSHYLYRHRRDCDHTVIFTSMRRYHPARDVRHMQYFPLRSYQCKERIRPCQCCQVLLSSVVTYDDALAQSSPAYWCSQCFDAMHKDKHGQLVYTNFIYFELEPRHDDDDNKS